MCVLFRVRLSVSPRIRKYWTWESSTQKNNSFIQRLDEHQNVTKIYLKAIMFQHVLSNKKEVLYNMLNSFQKSFFYTTFKP